MEGSGSEDGFIPPTPTNGSAPDPGALKTYRSYGSSSGTLFLDGYCHYLPFQVSLLEQLFNVVFLLSAH
jgi:hypothetical protein